ncbi:MAG: hypothetical protein ACI8W8_002467 [Rhodothermales bacterium]|jgi:hypothetical protein
MELPPMKLLLSVAVFAIGLTSIGADVPAVLPKPDQTPPSNGKVKVYVLAGQSNMVGFGTLTDAKPTYPSIYLSADPSLKVGRMPVGPSALLPFGVYQAKASVYAGAYNPGTDYSTLTPIKEATVALGTASAQLPSVDAAHTIVAKAFIDVPMSGMHELYAGFAESRDAVVTVDGKEVYRKATGLDAVVTAIRLEKEKRYPVTVTYAQGGSAAFWLKQIDLKGKGDLKTLTEQGEYTWFVDDKGEWTTRKDVTYWETRIDPDGGKGGPLTVTSNGRYIGPEVPFGYVMGTYHEEPVLLIESSMGNRALSFDFRPPSSGKTKEEKANKYCGLEYDLMIEGVHRTLKSIDKVVPNYQGQGYELAGFVWFQGHKDKDVPKAVYETHLVNLINDVRKEFKAPNMRAVVATVGFSGMEMEAGHFMTWEAQMAVGDPAQHPEFAGNVTSVDTRPFWRSRGESPTGTGYHYNHNAETYVLTGDALGRAMVRLLGGKAEAIPKPLESAQDANVAEAYSDAVTSTFNKRGPHYGPEYYREMAPALKPIIMDELVPSFLDTAFGPQGRSLKPIVMQAKPAKPMADIRSELDVLMEYYDMAGVDGYTWQPFGPDTRNAAWSYYSFDPPETHDRNTSDRYRTISFPEGMENWFAADFDAAKTGWRTGNAPFGQIGGKLDGLRARCVGSHCGCSAMPATLWEKEVLLMRRSFELPEIKDGHAYRLILGGAGCDRSGEGFAIYVNGKLLTQVKGGFFRHTGIRGAYLDAEILNEFKGGTVTIAVINFLRHTYFRNGDKYFGGHPDFRPPKAPMGGPVPANGHVTMWLEEAKLSPATLKAAAATAN